MPRASVRSSRAYMLGNACPRIHIGRSGPAESLTERTGGSIRHGGALAARVQHGREAANSIAVLACSPA
eukprot:2438996-Pleurochrysis_carterae.AAC.7